MDNITLMIGPMGSGKSKTLLEAIGIINNDKLEYLVFKPSIDTRAEDMITSRNGYSHKAINVTTFSDICQYVLLSNIDVIFIDEVQFIHKDGLKELIKLCKNRGVEIIAAGLNLTSELEPFETTALFLCYADKIVRLRGVCECGKRANYTEFLGIKKKSTIEIGGDEKYRSSCENCHKEFKIL